MQFLLFDMKQITNLNIKKARNFKDFDWDSDKLGVFKNLNLIYGWNGSGKTTLSDIFRMVEKGGDIQDESIEDFTIICGEETIQKNQLKSNRNLPSIKVFNRSFIEENIFNTSGKLPLILQIGKENIEEHQKLELDKENLKKLEASLSQKNNEHTNSTKSFDKFCTEKARSIKRELIGSNLTEHKNYNAKNFKNTMQSIIDNPTDKDNPSGYELSEEKINELKKIIDSNPQEKIKELSFSWPDLETIQENVKSLLEKSVVSESIPHLKDNGDLAEWVRSGLKIHKEKGLTHCEFCESVLLPARLDQLKKHFNKEFDELIGGLDQNQIAIDLETKKLNDIEFPDKARFYRQFYEKYEHHLSALKKYRDNVVVFLESLKTALDKKRNNLFLCTKFKETAPQNTDDYQAINDLIKDHNKQTDTYDKSIQEAAKELERALVFENLDEFKKQKNDIDNCQKAKENIEGKINTLKTTIDSLEKDITNHRVPAEKINEDLIKYLGHQDITLKVMSDKTGYALFRGEKRAANLSDGEKTAIALLFFLQSLEASNFEIKESIVVIDDPVSSLDENSLFTAYSFIKNKIKNAGQIFILTHNHQFFLTIKRWFYSHRNNNNQNAAVFQTIRNEGKSFSTIQTLDPLLQKFESEYHYLFSVIWKYSQTNQCGLSEYYHLPNIARRLLEGFFSFRFPQSNELRKSFKNLKSDNNISLDEIERFVGAYSHSDSMESLQSHKTNLLASSPKILSNIMKLIKEVDKHHYNEMVELISPHKKSNLPSSSQ